jgi:hypothetical protein
MTPLRIASDSLWTDINATYGRSGGAYRLHCLAPEGDTLLTIQRVLGPDCDGVLYIGKAKSYLSRVIGLKKGLSPTHKSEPHIGGRRYWHDRHESLRKAFPYERLCVTFEPAADPRGKENELLNAYCTKFGEAPPLNNIG